MWTFQFRLQQEPYVWYAFSLLIPFPPFISSISQTAPGPVNMPAFQPVRPLPSVQFRVERVNVEHSVPMYAPELVSTVSNLSQPSDNLLHHCYAHLYLKVSMTMFHSNPSWGIWQTTHLIPVHLIIIRINFAYMLLKELFLVKNCTLHLHLTFPKRSVRST